MSDQGCNNQSITIIAADAEGAASLFTPKGKLINPKGEFAGRDAIKAFFNVQIPMIKGTRHLTCNVQLVLGSLPVQAVSQRLLIKACTPSALLVTGSMEDTFEKGDDGSWAFSVRKFNIDPPAAPPAVAS